MKTILVTGANGFIGQHLLKYLKGYKVVAADRSDFDLTDLISMRAFFKMHNPDIVINLAANKSRGASFEDFRQMIEVNLLGALNILEASVSCSSIKHFIFIGSAEEYGDSEAPFFEEQKEKPASAYAYSKTASKILLETLSRHQAIPFTYLRPTLVYGPNQGEEMFLPALIKSLRSEKRFQLTKGEQVRDYLHVKDLCGAILKVIEKPKEAIGHVYNVGSGEVKSIGDVAKFVSQKLNVEDLLDIGAIPYRENEIFDYRVSIDKIREDLGWVPMTSIEEGLLDLLS